MTISYIKSNYKEIPAKIQQENILNYVKNYSLSIDTQKSISNLGNDDGIEFLRTNVKNGDTLLIDDLWVFGERIGQMVRALNCLIKRDVTIHLCSSQVVIDKNLPTTIMLELLDMKRVAIYSQDISSMGRPKGSLSKSKFDVYKEQITSMLRDKKSVSEIANRLNISRSSLKDYINSRSLKEIAFVDNYKSDIKLQNSSFILPQKNCIEDKKELI